ncbi:unnamed protein product [Chrysoparadoxa australica]
MKQEMQNEINILRRLDHPNIIKAHETFTSSRRIYLIMELCTGGDLSARAPYKEKEAIVIMRKLLSAVGYMHEHNVVHRDLKLENVMFESREPDADIKCIDFGLSKIYINNRRMHDMVGTLYSMAPEVMHGGSEGYGPSCDVWSLGVIAYVLLSGRFPFDCRNKVALRAAVKKGVYNFSSSPWRKISKEAKHFISKMIVKDPRHRPSCAKAQRHKWLSQEPTSLPSSSSGTPSLSHRSMDTDSSVCQSHPSYVKSLTNFSEFNKIKKIALMVIAHRSSPTSLKQLRDAFAEYDREQTGAINIREFKTVLAEYNYPEDELVELFEKLDNNHDGSIHYTEFLAATLETMGAVTLEKLHDAFDQLDEDDSGAITKANLLKLLGQEGKNYDVDALIQEADIDATGDISLEEFMILMQEGWGQEEKDLREEFSMSPRKFGMREVDAKDLGKARDGLKALAMEEFTTLEEEDLDAAGKDKLSAAEKEVVSTAEAEAVKPAEQEVVKPAEVELEVRQQ